MDVKNEQGSDKQDYLDELSGQGFEGMGAGDYNIPFLKILQSGSPEVKKGTTANPNPDYVDGAEEGMFMNSLTKKLYGTEIHLIPLKYEPMWIQWAPNRGGLRGRCSPGSIKVTGDPFKGMKDEEGNEVVDNMIFYCLMAEHLDEGPIVFALSATGMRHGKNWNTMINNVRNPSGAHAAFFSSVWKISTTHNANAQGDWYQIGTQKTSNIVRTRFATKEELLSVIVPNRQALLSAANRISFEQLEGNAPKELAAPSAGGAQPEITY
jgi:hypothetical protein